MSWLEIILINGTDVRWYIRGLLDSRIGICVELFGSLQAGCKGFVAPNLQIVDPSAPSDVVGGIISRLAAMIGL